jgi:hypothetical protein
MSELFRAAVLLFAPNLSAVRTKFFFSARGILHQTFNMKILTATLALRDFAGIKRSLMAAPAYRLLMVASCVVDVVNIIAKIAANGANLVQFESRWSAVLLRHKRMCL